MLVEFTVGNFRSISEKVTLSMIAAPIKSGAHGKHLDEENVIKIDEKLSLLKSAALFGANASGKSNVLTALQVMKNYALNSVHNQEIASPFQPYLLQIGYENKPSHYEIVFIVEGVQYRYGFEASGERVEKEWFYFVPKSREALLFEREGSDIKIGGSFKGARGLETRLTERALFLTVANDFNVAIARLIVSQLSQIITIFNYSDDLSQFSIKSIEKGAYRDQIVDFISGLDLGISNIEVVATQNSSNSERQREYRVETTHQSFNCEGKKSGKVKLDLFENESQGTQKLFALAGILFDALEFGRVLVLDEMDTKLHPFPTQEIAEFFNSKIRNPNNAQLIFATHNSNLLDNRLFRRDQIWFTEKNRIGATNLYSLVEFKVRNDASYEKDYLEGRYGAIPFIGSYMLLSAIQKEENV